ncbi:MAG: hypothetical protein WCK16_00005, partial [Candidatus Moraniibacteriota bacterium]
MIFLFRLKNKIIKHPKFHRAIFLIRKYSIITSIIFGISLVLWHNFPEKYQLANLGKPSVETQFIASNAMVANQDNGYQDAMNRVSTGNQNQTPTTMTNNGQSVVLAETIVNDQVAFAKATADQGKKTLQMAGSLTGKDGKPVEGTYPIRFAIYTKDRNTLDPAPSDTDQNQRIWEETRDITFKNGIFQVELGEVTDLPTITENSNQLFIGMKVNTDSEMVPRKRISTPLFSFNAGNSITL